MRKQTERKYRKCPEVINKKIEIKKKEEFKTNKIMANIFNKVNIYLILTYNCIHQNFKTTILCIVETSKKNIKRKCRFVQ